MVLRLLYSVGITVWAFFALVSRHYQFFQRGRRRVLLEKLGFTRIALSPKKGKRIWIHAVSLGEAKAIAHLLVLLQSQFENLSIVISTSTKTGYDYLSKLPQVDSAFFLPLDFCTIQKRLISDIDPDLFALVETDYWWNLLSLLHAKKIPTLLVNGKISSRSLRRYLWFSNLAKKLFDQFSMLLVQNTGYALDFETLQISSKKIHVTGNLKFDAPIDRTEQTPYFPPTDKRRICLALTHPKEERLLLDHLRSLPNLEIVVAPRHPERFEEVRSLLLEGEHLIDEMGVLDRVYLASDLVVMGGSFLPRIGGHNLLEACRLSTPVLFGPYMEDQLEIRSLVLASGMGKEVDLSTLKEEIYWSPKDLEGSLKRLQASLGSPSQTTFEIFRDFLC